MKIKNRYLIILIILLSLIAIKSSPKKTASFNNDEKTKEEKKEPFKINVVNKKTGEIINLDLENYIIGVVAGEMPASFDVEALKAQAIASRTYALYKIKNNKTLTTDISTQVYITNEDMQNKWKENYNLYYEKIKNAVLETKDLVITYNGDLISSYYFAMSNGKTEDSKLVFGTDVEYLKSVESNENIETKKTISMSKSDFCTKLSIDCQDIVIKNEEKTSSGRIQSIVINNKIFKGTEIRTLLGLRSTDFNISLDENNIIITTNGYGHGVGMCQYGANALAKSGYNYEEILKHYYQNTNITKINV